MNVTSGVSESAGSEGQRDGGEKEGRSNFNVNQRETRASVCEQSSEGAGGAQQSYYLGRDPSSVFT